nr:hypothetical protein [Tanacetum cinerariifolium]
LPGDTPTRRSSFDSLLAGCIPVCFEELSAKKQYVWHLPEDEYDEFLVMILKKDVVFMLGWMYVVTRNAQPLKTDCIPSHEKKKKMKKKKEVNECIQETWEFIVLRNQKDAFDIAVEGTIQRIKARLESLGDM